MKYDVGRKTKNRIYEKEKENGEKGKDSEVIKNSTKVIFRKIERKKVVPKKENNNDEIKEELQKKNCMVKPKDTVEDIRNKQSIMLEQLASMFFWFKFLYFL